MTDPSPNQGEPSIIGWREKVDLPEWGLMRVRAKTDTGARTSAIDVAEIEELDEGRVRFRVVYHHNPRKVTRWIYADTVRTSSVKPSHGKTQQRHVCRTIVRIGEIERRIEISLVSRRGMRCRMLLGRTALDGLLVDANSKYLLTSARRRARVTDPILEHPIDPSPEAPDAKEHP